MKKTIQVINEGCPKDDPLVKVVRRSDPATANVFAKMLLEKQEAAGSADSGRSGQKK